LQRNYRANSMSSLVKTRLIAGEIQLKNKEIL